MQSEYNNQMAALADLDQQIAEKAAEIAAARNSIDKYRASSPFVQQQADLRSELMKLQFSNKLAYLQAQQTLVEQQHQISVLESQEPESASAPLLSFASRFSLQQFQTRPPARAAPDQTSASCRPAGAPAATIAGQLVSAMTATSRSCSSVAPADA
jgi:hypothetical protein